MKNSMIVKVFKEMIEGGKFENEKSHGLELDEIYHFFKGNLDKDLFLKFERFSKLLTEDFCDEVDFFFAEGFKMGLLIGVECGK